MRISSRPNISFVWAPILAWAVVGALTESPAMAAGEAKTRAKGTVTFTKDIAPLVFDRCANCHRPGEVAPFPLLSYRDVSKRARLIQTVIEERKMPPWKAEPGPEHFVDERRLSDAQVAAFTRWVEDGLPEGNPSDLPPQPKFTSGWHHGEPDMVVKMAEPYSLVAEGADVYRCFVIPLELPAGKYLKAVEYRPGNRQVVHHAVLSMLPHKMAQAKLAEGDGKSFGSGLAPPGQLLPGQLAFWTPGMETRPLPDGFAVDWPKQVDLVLQLHLHPSGKPETELSTIGLHFTDEKPRKRLNLVVMNNEKIDISPGNADHVVKASVTLPVDAQLYGIFPHMHLLGRTVKVTATLPDGTVKPLIAIDDWDFQWQMYYEYAKPIALPSGTRLDGRFSYDNSAANPANPSKPPKRIGYGEQTSNEMAIVILDVVTNGPMRRGGNRGAMSSKPATK
jgi:mono/diheme cytochrome c family protein